MDFVEGLPRLYMDLILQSPIITNTNPLVHEFVKGREAIQQLLEENLQKSQEMMKLYAYMRRNSRREMKYIWNYNLTGINLSKNKV